MKYSKILIGCFLLVSVQCWAIFDPIALYLTWNQHPESSMLIRWITEKDRANDLIEYQLQGSSQWHSINGTHANLPANTPYIIHHAELKNLQPSSIYLFRFGQESPIYKFETMPLTFNEEIRFIAGGDMYHDSIDQLRETNRQAAKTNPHFALIGGDIAYASDRFGDFLPRWTHAWLDLIMGQKFDRWLAWLVAWKNDMVRPNGCLIPLLPVLGNHDTNGRFGQTPAQAPFFYALFPMPGPQGYNVLDFGDYMSIFLLDSGHTHPVDGQQANWLKNALQQRAQKRHKFALYHVPAYPSMRSYKQKISTQIRKYWVPSFEAFHLTAAFENHDHDYKRTFQILHGKVDSKGVLYLGDGAWGVMHPRKARHSTKKWYLARTESRRHFLFVSLKTNARYAAAIDSQGSLFDEYYW